MDKPIVTLHRFGSTSNCTYGTLSIFHLITMRTLEPKNYIVAPGRYLVTWTFSPKFNRYMPLINGVLGHSAVRIHWGNTVDDTSGCILVGCFLSPSNERLISSRYAFSYIDKYLFKKDFILVVE